MNATHFRLSDALSLRCVRLSLAADDRDGVLRELIDCIPDLADNPPAREKLFRALLEREQLHSTGIGDGIALPHARNALVGLVDRPVIVFGRHAKGIPYGAIDRQPARLFFLLVATNVSQHLSLLARISRVLRDPRVRQELSRAEKAERVVEVIREAEAQG